jgi:gamma-glutamyl hercynylcysteine S-oxide synthase
MNARQATARQLAALLQASRQQTLALLDAYVAALGESLLIPQSETLNPPLWELGHLAWFADHWLFPDLQRIPHYDARYDSSHVAHSSRWSLPLPNLTQTKALLDASLEAILQKLSQVDSDSDVALYFYRLALFHEDMHAEAAIYSAAFLNIPIPQALLRLPFKASASTNARVRVPAGRWLLGSQAGDAAYPQAGFAFDNELGQHEVALAAFEIDARAVTWRQYLPFVEATGRDLPQIVGDLDAAAVHLNLADAQAWCAWAGRRLPTEAEWECAAITFGASGSAQFIWGEVWEWTASTFTPYPGFAPHAYSDYSEPWFGTHQVLRGASVATSKRMVHPKYRNFFLPHRRDIHAGFRSCAL